MELGTTYPLYGVTTATTVYSKLYSTFSVNGNTLLSEERTPGGSNVSYREPDLLIGTGDSYDVDSEYYNMLLGGSGTANGLASAFLQDYREMLTSVGKYGGFYIGRYELTGSVTSPTEKSGKVLVGQNWYNLYNACRNVVSTEEVQSTMIWGCQWDATCSWLEQNGYSTSDSSSWGNYSNSERFTIDNTNVKYTIDGITWYSIEKGDKKPAADFSILTTGASKYTKANNIYDFAGNNLEWTQEAYKLRYRSVRGGGYYGTRL